MASFAYRAIDDRGRMTRGTINAPTPRHARDQLRGRGLQVENVREKHGDALRSVRPNRRTRYRGQLTVAIRELATLLQAGVPLLDALDSLQMQCKKGFRDAVSAVRDRVAEGESLASAMEKDPETFDDMSVGMIRVGEAVGNLDEVCEQIADFRERTGELKDRVVSAVLYPAIVMLVSVGVTLFLMTVVVPMLLQNLTQIGRPLPTPTLILKTLSDGLIDYGFVIFATLAATLVAIGSYVRSENGGRRVDRIALKSPVLGTLIQKQALSRMALVVSSLLRSGVELVDALAIAESSTTNRLLKSALEAMQRDLRSGRDLAESTTQHEFFTPSLTQVFALGQKSGQLDRMLQRLGNDYDRQAGLLANRLTTVIEPVLILFLSIVVGFILFATVLPILEAGNVLAN